MKSDDTSNVIGATILVLLAVGLIVTVVWQALTILIAYPGY